MSCAYCRRQGTALIARYMMVLCEPFRNDGNAVLSIACTAKEASRALRIVQKRLGITDRDNRDLVLDFANQSDDLCTTEVLPSNKRFAF